MAFNVCRGMQTERISICHQVHVTPIMGWLLPEIHSFYSFGGHSYDPHCVFGNTKGCEVQPDGI